MLVVIVGFLVSCFGLDRIRTHVLCVMIIIVQLEALPYIPDLTARPKAHV
jgi:hypothetical protein